MQDYVGESHDEMLDREAADLESERAHALWHASAVRFCPECAVEVLTRRDGSCCWCDGPTNFSEGIASEPRPATAKGSSRTAAAPSLNPSPAAAGVTGPQGPSVACTAPLSRSAGRDTRSGAPGEPHNDEEMVA
jgi:hypothetical protein